MKMVNMPRRRPNSMSDQESPIMALDSAVMSGKSAWACSKRPGSGLRQLHCVVVVRAEVEGVDVRADALQFSVWSSAWMAEYVRGGMEAEGDAALVGDDDDAQAGAIERAMAWGTPGRVEIAGETT